MSPLRILDRLLDLVLPSELSESLRGDLEEGWRTRLERRGRLAAWGWYLGHVVRLPVLKLRRRTRRLRRNHWAEVHGPGGGGRVGRAWQDLRVGSRGLRRRPGFSTVVLLTLALSIGAATLIFSVLEAAFFRPLPYPGAGRIVSIHTANDQWRSSGNARLRELWNRFPTSLAQIDAAARAPGLSAVGGGATTGLVVRGVGPPERATAALVSEGLFEVLGTSPLFGRLPSDEELRAGAPVAVVSHRFWTRVLGRDPDALGRTVTLGERSVSVIGVMPPRFFFPDGSEDLWMPLPASFQGESRTLPVLFAVGRLTPAAEVAEVSMDLDGRSRRLGEEEPALAGLGMRAALRAEEAVEGVRSGLTLLMAAVTLVVLLAAVNLGNIVLARASRRRGEIAVRRALGAGRLDIASALLAEVLLLAVAGGAVGVLAALLLLDPFVAALASLDLTPATEVRLDVGVLSFAAGTTLLAALGAGLPIALRAAGRWPGRFLGEGRRTGATLGTRRTLSALLVAETAMAFVLLAGAGLLVHSVARIAAVDPGYRPEGLHYLQLLPTETRYPEEAGRIELVETILRRVAARPDMGPAVLSAGIPSSGTVTWERLRAVEQPTEEASDIETSYVSPGYFELAGIPRLRGRGFEAGPDAGSEAVLSESLARQTFGPDDPIGRRVVVESFDGDPDTARVVGVVADARVVALPLEGEPHLYRPVSRTGWEDLYVMVRADLPTETALPALRETALSVDPDLLLGASGTVADAAWTLLDPMRLRAFLLGAMAGLAMILAAVGVFGVMAHVVEERTREIGLRIALGAAPRRETRRLVRSFLAIAAIGTSTGMVLAVVASRFLESFIHEVHPLDPWSYVGAALLMATLAGVAAWIPARRAARVDPVRVLNRD